VARLRTVQPRIKQHARQTMASVPVVADRRITGTTLQNRRRQAWANNPECAACGRVVVYPHGFELDHIVPLYMGGADHIDNCQILCVYYHSDGTKQGCHADKTKAEQ
jgi:5-methylcytosine-specific restriction endonuclease McrA